MRWLLLLGLGGVSVAGTWQAMMSPGPLVADHDDFAGDCDQCHLVFDGIPDSRCLDCHDGLATRIRADRGFHATVADQACIDCHVDHLGLEASGTQEAARAAFDHDATGFPVEGAHGALGCADCHTGPIGEVQATCGGCHDDPHSSALGPVCESCHVSTAWAAQLKDRAAHLLQMEGKHAEQGCEDCHLHGEHLVRDVPCVDCHGDAHDGLRAPCEQCHDVNGWTPARFDHGPCTCAFAGVHQTAACLDCHADFDFTDTPVLCSGCHESDRTTHEPLGECSRCHNELSWADDQFDHNGPASRFHLEGKHYEVGCTGCHTTPGQFRGEATVCEGCHAADGETAHGDFGPCATCHAAAGWTPSSFDHASTGFPLVGRHTEATCQSCHADKVEGYPR